MPVYPRIREIHLPASRRKIVSFNGYFFFGFRVTRFFRVQKRSGKLKLFCSFKDCESPFTSHLLFTWHHGRSYYFISGFLSFAVLLTLTDAFYLHSFILQVDGPDVQTRTELLTF